MPTAVNPLTPDTPHIPHARRAPRAMWLLLPVWMVVYAMLVQLLVGILGEGGMRIHATAFLDVFEFLLAESPLSRGASEPFTRWLGESLVWLYTLIAIFAVPVLQWAMFMLPADLPKVANGPSSLFAAVVAVSLMAAVLTAMPLALLGDAVRLARDELGEWPEGMAIAVLAVWVLTWPLWTYVLWRRANGGADWFETVVTRVTTGTAIGTGLAIPWYALVRSRESCYCALCSYWSLVSGLWALLMLGGPLLLFLRRRRRALRDTSPAVVATRR